MKYAPILIPTLCRSEHLKRLVESLKRNTWAQYTDVYIALDYPSEDSHWKGYEEICDYLNEDFSEFLSFNVIKREYNFGSCKNSFELKRYILDRYDRFIRTDDDCEFSPNFLEYMNKCLDRYEQDDSVVAVTGYSHPVDWVIADGCNAFKSKAIFPMWGTGFWKKKHELMENALYSQYIRKQYFAGNVCRKNMTDARYLDAIQSSTSIGTDDLMFTMSDAGCGGYIQLADKYIITPKTSLVRNHGFDGTGVYCQNTVGMELSKNARFDLYDYRLQVIDDRNSFDLYVDESADVRRNMEVINCFDYRSEYLVLKYRIKSIVKRIIFWKWKGIESTHTQRVFMKMRKFKQKMKFIIVSPRQKWGGGNSTSLFM